MLTLVPRIACDRIHRLGVHHFFNQWTLVVLLLGAMEPAMDIRWDPPSKARGRGGTNSGVTTNHRMASTPAEIWIKCHRGGKTQHSGFTDGALLSWSLKNGGFRWKKPFTGNMYVFQTAMTAQMRACTVRVWGRVCWGPRCMPLGKLFRLFPYLWNRKIIVPSSQVHGENNKIMLAKHFEQGLV